MDKQHKIQRKNYIIWGIIALVVLVLAAMPLLASRNIPADGPQASILTADAALRQIDTQLIGGGQLASSAKNAITVPEKVKLTGYLVGNGDIVEEGEPIAAVDKVSVLSALAEVQETLDHLAGKLADAVSSADSDEVTAHAGGLVKILYGQKGDSVREVMLEHGSLAVLSLDGRMAVDIRRSTGLKNGSTVCVILEDDTEVEGKVESASGEALTVSIEDAGYAIGAKVTVKTEDGDRLGSGDLYIHNAWKATAYYGTISKVNAEEGDVLSAGKTLFELEVSDYSSQLQILNAQRQDYEALMQELFRMYDSGVITAPCDGIVTGVDNDGSFLLSAQEQAWQLQPLGYSTSSPQAAYSVILLSNVQENEPESSVTPPDAEPAPNPPASEEEGNPAEPVPVCTKSEGCTAPVHEPGCPLSGVTEQTYSGWVAIVELVEDGSAVLKKNPNAIQTSNINGLTVNPNVLTEAFVYPGTTYSNGAAIEAGDTVFLHLQGGIEKIGGASDSIPQQPQEDAMGNMAGSMGGAMGGSMGGGAAAVFEPYTLDTLTIATVTSQEKMTLEITVDEQDIGALHTGQEATVTIEALTGQSFPAVVTAIGNTGTNEEGGSSKFTATLTLSKSGDMLPGMNASAFLTLDSTEPVLCIPVAALADEGTKTLVYTGYSEEDGSFLNPAEVTTGVSDGDYVEILSGLDVGDVVYYPYYDTLEISNVPEAGHFGF